MIKICHLFISQINGMMDMFLFNLIQEHAFLQQYICNQTII